MADMLLRKIMNSKKFKKATSQERLVILADYNHQKAEFPLRQTEEYKEGKRALQ